MEERQESFGRYKVLGAIGSGGMGEVYVAHDPTLGRKVAIKILPLRLTTDHGTLSRFTQEARSASALNHPNIVTIHEVDAAKGVPFIVMEYIDGSDLRTLTAEGPLPVRRVLDIAAQIADGLAAAHERGIIHRDLKPENVMVTRDGYVKILDFGLAKVTSPSPSGDNTLQLDIPATNPGTILGTVGYMSPEQATGKRLDFRSDQFALGAILYELLTGSPAFEEETAIDTLSAILHKDPPPLTRSHKRVPVQFADIIKRLVAKAPDGRYSSTRDLAQELRVVRDRVIAEESGFHEARPLLTPARSIVAGAIAIAVVGLLTFAVLFTKGRLPGVQPEPPSANVAARKYLAVTRFKDLSGDPNGQLVVDGFGETLTTRLAHYPMLQVTRSKANDSEPLDPAAVARNLGANLVLSGSMMRSGSRIRVTYSVLDAATGREWRDLVEGDVADLFGVQDDVADSVARNLALGPTTARTTLDPAISQREYLEALGHLGRYDKEESVDSAIAILKRLGSSPSVQAALARAYLCKFQITRDPRWAAEADRTANVALRADPQSVDVNITLGELWRQTGRYKEANAAFLRALSQQPNNADAVLGSAEAYKAAGDLRNAESAYKQAIQLQPNYWGGYNKLGAFYYAAGRLEDAVAMFQRVVKLVPDNQRGYNNLGGAYQLLGRYKEAVDVFSQSIARKPSSQGYSNLGTCYYFLGRYDEAAKAFEKATELTPQHYMYWRNLGDAYRWVPGQEHAASRAFQQSIELSTKAIDVNSGDGLAHLCLAVSLAKSGQQAKARSVLLRALELEPRNPAFVYDAAVIASIAGDEDEALARLQQAVRLGYNASDIARDPEFANLKKRGRLQSIAQ
jgi:tetratricopeptide (TPR) repeat protein/TolB-like protein